MKIFIFLILISKNAFAYIDPGIMTVVWQTAVLVLMSIGVTIKIFWYKIVSIFFKIKNFFGIKIFK